MFRTLINIDNDLRAMFTEIEHYFSIALDNTIIEKIFKDAEEDQVSQKEYLIFQSTNSSSMTIRGIVEEYEPFDIWILIENIKDKDIKHFVELTSR